MYKDTIEQLGGEFVYSPLNKQTSTTEMDIEELEVKLGATLPSNYRIFLADFGGYAFDDVFFPLGDGSSIDLDVFYGINIGLTLDSFHNWSINFINGTIPQHLLPIANNGSRSLFLIGLFGDSAGKVYLLSEDRLSVPYDINSFIFISDSFDEFLVDLNRY